MIRREQFIRASILIGWLGYVGWARPVASGRLVVNVSPSGDDRASGTPEAPVATLQAGLARVRANGSHPGGSLIQLAAGTYRLPATFELEPDDSGDPGAPLVIEGPASGEARLTGAKELADLVPPSATACPARVPTAARGHIWSAHLDAKIWPDLPGMVATGFGRSLAPQGVELLFRRQVMPLAGWPDQGYAALAHVAADDPGHVFGIVETEHLASWRQEPDLWAFGYWNQDWRDSYERVEAVDSGTDRIRLAAPGPIGGMTVGQRFRVLNALAELDHPGEWYQDRTTRTLYFWPPSPPHIGDVELTLLPVLVRVKGAHDIVFRRLTLDGTRTSAMSLQGVQSILVESCRFENIGGAGVDLVGKDSRIENCQIQDTGEGGIYLTGGNRQTLIPGGLVARGNRIVRFNRWGRCYRPAIELNGVGNTAESNIIEEGTHVGILFYGNDHRIACNTISRVCLETGDAAAIYSGQDWTARGCIIEQNHISDVWGTQPKPVVGIYLDDQLSGTTVRGNLLQRVQLGILVGGGRDNLIQGNWFDRCDTAVIADGRGLTWQKNWISDPSSPLRRALDLVPYTSDKYRRYPSVANVLTNFPGAPVGTSLVDNHSVGPFHATITPEARPWITNRNNGEAASLGWRPCDGSEKGNRP